MDENFNKMQTWFETLNKKIDDITDRMVSAEHFERKINGLVTNERFEARFNLLLTAMTNLHDRVERYRDEQQATNVLFSRAIHDLDRDVTRIKQVTL